MVSTSARRLGGTQGIRLEINTPLGCIGILQHQWKDAADGSGVLYDSFMHIGMSAATADGPKYPNASHNPIARGLVNNVLIPRKMPARKIVRWLTHNVEEVGMLERFLPTVYNERAKLVVPSKSVLDLWAPARGIPLAAPPPAAEGVTQWWQAGGKALDPMRPLPVGGKFTTYPVPPEADRDPAKVGSTLLFDALTAPSKRVVIDRAGDGTCTC